MFKTSMAVMLLTTAQEAFAKMTRDEVNALIDANIAANDYLFEIGATSTECSESNIRRSLKWYF